MECLVTKLKASVADDLPRLGEIIIEKAVANPMTASTQYLQISIKDDVVLNALDGASFYADNTLTSLLGSTINFSKDVQNRITWVTNGGKVSIRKKYDLLSLLVPNVYKINMKELDYCTSLKELNLVGVTNNEALGDLKDFSLTLPRDMETLSLRLLPNLTGDISSLSHIALKNLTINGNMNYVGNIADLNVSRIETLSIADTSIGGSIESLVAKLIASGRASGKIAMPYIKANRVLTYKGSPLYLDSSIPSSIGAMSWTSDGTITWSAS